MQLPAVTVTTHMIKDTFLSWSISENTSPPISFRFKEVNKISHYLLEQLMDPSISKDHLLFLQGTLLVTHLQFAKFLVQYVVEKLVIFNCSLLFSNV